MAYNHTETISSQIDTSYNNLRNLETNPVAAFFTGVAEVAKIFKSVFIIPVTAITGDGGIISTLASDPNSGGVGLPTWVYGLVISLIVILVVFAFAAIVNKWWG